MASSLVSCFGTSELSAVGMLLDESEGRAGGFIARRHLGKSGVRKALDVEVAVSRILKNSSSVPSLCRRVDRVADRRLSLVWLLDL